VNVGVLLQFEEFLEFRSRTLGEATAADPDTSDLAAPSETTPGETIAKAIAEANNAVAAEVLDRVREREPAFLERLVLNVLTAMGTGARPGPQSTWAGSISPCLPGAG
jgi:restriction system protein